MSDAPLNILITKKADANEEAVYKYIACKFGKIYADYFRARIIKYLQQNKSDLYPYKTSNPVSAIVNLSF